ncbi:MAG: phytanoyl-CoA dioxygenase family protein, partial [Pirellulales bacterium]
MPLTDVQLQQFQDDGFLIVRDFFRPEQLAPVIEWIDQLVDDLANRLFDAGINGTLQVIRGGHASGKVFRHRPEKLHGHADSWYLAIDEADLPPGEVVTCEMATGSMLLINQLIPHRSTENLSDIIRWSVDLRWQRPGEQSGFEGIKDCILMRNAANANYRIDWS